MVSNSPVPFYIPRTPVGRFAGIHFDANDDPPQNPPPGDDPPQNPPADDAKPIMNEAQLKERLERAEVRTKAALLKELGFEKIEDAKARIDKATELEREKMTDTERLKAEADDAKKQAAEHLATITRLNEMRQRDQQKGSLESVLRAAGITDADDLEYATDRALKYVAANLEGQTINAESMKSFTEELKTKKPQLFEDAPAPLSTGRKPRQPAPTGGDSTPKPKSDAEIAAMSDEEFEDHLQNTISSLPSG